MAILAAVFCQGFVVRVLQDSVWIEIVVRGQGFSSFYALPVAQFRELGRSRNDRLRALEGLDRHQVDQPIEVEEDVPYYFIPVCNSRRQPDLVSRSISRRVEEITLRCPG
jgi:hypothetical protein